MSQWICPDVKQVFDRVIDRYAREPQLWHDQFAPVPRLFLVYGQKGSDLNFNVDEIAEQYDYNMRSLWCSENIKEMEKDWANMKKSKKHHLLLIKDAHLLPFHNSLFHESFDLQQTFYQFQMIVVVSEDVPKPDHPFWNQFAKEQTILYSLPTRDFRLQYIENFLQQWNEWWTHSNLNMSTEDMQVVAEAANFSTLHDINVFLQRVTRYVTLRFPEECVDITLQLMQDRFMNRSVTVDGSWSITDVDLAQQRSRYNTYVGKSMETARSSESVASYMERHAPLKRARTNQEEEKLEIE